MNCWLFWIITFKKEIRYVGWFRVEHVKETVQRNLSKLSTSTKNDILWHLLKSFKGIMQVFKKICKYQEDN